MVNNWLSIIQNNVFKPSCIFCGGFGKDNMDICGSCLSDLPVNAPACHRCAKPLNREQDDIRLCGRCIADPPAFDACHAHFHYPGPLAYLITGLKFAARFQNARLLGQLSGIALSQDKQSLPDCLLPMPLHPSRYRQRGFNQSIEIARTLSKQLRIPLDLASCQRVKNTPQQTQLSAKQRASNVRNAFSVKKNLPYRHVVIFDDVMTTGSSANELAKILKQQVEKVDVWVCARA